MIEYHSFIATKVKRNTQYNYFICERCKVLAFKLSYYDHYILVYPDEDNLTCNEIIIKNIIE